MATKNIAMTDDKPRWMMHGITSEPVEAYLYSLLPARDEVLSEIESAAAKRNIPIVGPAVAQAPSAPSAPAMRESIRPR